LKFNDRFGPAREVHVGSGYWSQDSAVQVFGTPEPPTHIVVRWPGGQTVVSEVPAGAREIVCSTEGVVTRDRVFEGAREHEATRGGEQKVGR
jgi:hypothetical protein